MYYGCDNYFSQNKISFNSEFKKPEINIPPLDVGYKLNVKNLLKFHNFIVNIQIFFFLLKNLYKEYIIIYYFYILFRYFKKSLAITVTSGEKFKLIAVQSLSSMGISLTYLGLFS